VTDTVFSSASEFPPVSTTEVSSWKTMRWGKRAVHFSMEGLSPDKKKNAGGAKKRKKCNCGAVPSIWDSRGKGFFWFLVLHTIVFVFCTKSPLIQLCKPLSRDGDSLLSPPGNLEDDLSCRASIVWMGWSLIHFPCQGGALKR